MKQIFTTGLVLSGVIAYAQPSGSCTAGTTKLGTDGKLYGCVETSWRKLTEDVVSNASIGSTQGITQNVNGVVQAREQDNSVSQLNNIGFTPISVSDAPSHVVGKIFYSSAKKHFYQGVSGGLWHQIDNEIFTPSPKCLELVYDRNYGDGDHNFIYCAVQGPNGKKWLNLNLGAEYAREPSINNPNPDFNPEAIPTNYKDYKAFGSIFQEGRKADGHELVNYSTEKIWNFDYSIYMDFWVINRKYPITTLQQNPLNSNNQYVNGSYWMNDIQYNADLWKGKGMNNPCPIGYRVMNVDDIKSIFTDNVKLINVEGEMTTPTIIKRTDIPYFNLFTAPQQEDFLIGKNKQEQRYMGETMVENDDLSLGIGTSSLWLLPDNTHLGAKMIEYDIEYQEGWLGARNANIDSSKLAYHYTFDRGIMQSDSYNNVGYGGVEYTKSMAIRCVEQ